MNTLTREDYIELGIGVPTETLVEWASDQLDATKGREARLETRGLNSNYLSGVKDLLSSLDKPGAAADSAVPQVALAQALRVEALGYLREAQQIAKAEFGTKPDVLAKFRRGVLTGLLIANLARELEIVVGLLREHAPELAALGGNDAFIARGTTLIQRLGELKSGLDRACRALPAPQAQQCHDKGLLYDLTRKLVRVGRLEFARDPESAADFNFTGVRRPRKDA